MRTEKVKNMRNDDFVIRNIYFYKQTYFTNGSEVVFLNKTRIHHGFLYLKACSIDIFLPSGEVMRAKQGDLIYLPSGSRYRSRFSNVDGQVPSLLFNFDLELDGNPYAFSDGVTFVNVRDKSALQRVFDRAEKTSDSRISLKACIYSILEMWDAEQAIDNVKGKEILIPAVLYMEKNPHVSVSVSELAQKCHLSKSFFRKRFHEVYGVSPKDFCLNRRILEAKALLESGELNVSEVSALLDFSSPAYFSRIFKKKTGTSPANCRKNEHRG